MVTFKDNTMRISLERKVDASFDILSGRDLFQTAADNLRQNPLGSRYAVIADSGRVSDAQTLCERLQSSGIKARVFTSGIDISGAALGLMGSMSKEGYGRDCAVISVGEDNVAGFIAAYFNRGVPLIIFDNPPSDVENNYYLHSTGDKMYLQAVKFPRRVFFRGEEGSEHKPRIIPVDDSYDIVFGNNMFRQIAQDLRKLPIGFKFAIVTDSNVKRLYAEKLAASLEEAGLEPGIFSIEAGEQSKTFHSCEKMIEEMAEVTDYDGIIALGGGVTGDMAGFMAAMINLPYIQIPTTLLAQADSSIGGKTAVDTEFGKNLVGAFKQPRRVYLDIATLATLPEREYISGLAETIKHGFIQDADFFNYLLENISRIKSRDQEILLEIAMNNCRIKGNVVEQDPEERGLRSILNFGHTIGHAIEKLSVDRYEKCLSTDYLSHGEAIAIGGMAAARISRLSGFLAADDLEQLEFLLTEVGLKTRIPAWMENGKIIDITLRDKKARDGKARYALPIAKGRMHDFGGKYTTFVENELVIQALNMTR